MNWEIVTSEAYGFRGWFTVMRDGRAVRHFERRDQAEAFIAIQAGERRAA